MHTRFWVYRRNLSNNPQSLFRSNRERFMQKAGCCISGFLGFLFLGLAVFCLFSPEVDTDRKLFLTFTGLSGIFEIICFMYSCIPWYHKYCRSYNVEEDEEFSRSLLSSEKNAYEEVPGKEGIVAYQTSIGYPEGPSYQGVPSYQNGPKYQEVSDFIAAPYGAEGGYHPGLACFRPLVNYEGVFAHQQIPIYQQDLVEPQLPPYSQTYKECNTVPQCDISVY